MKVAVVGCQGVPAQYGGYETLVEYLVEYRPKGVEVTVYCSASKYPNKQNLYKGVCLKYIHLPSNGLMSCIYDMYTILISVFRYDKILLLGSSGGFILPFLFPFRNKFVLNIGGIEWARSKYSPIMQRIVRVLMWVSVKSSGLLIADNQGIKEYIKKEYNRDDATVIAYGGDQAQRLPITEELVTRYPFLGDKYAIAIARVQSDNNVEVLLEAFKKALIPLVYIGNWDVSDYAKSIRKKYSCYSNLILLDAIYDLSVLNVLRGNCYFYVHGHSAGGTNPSLVEAMHLEVPLVCFCNIFNKYVTEDKAYYFNNVAELNEIVNSLDELSLQQNAKLMKMIAMEKYTWKSIAQQYYNFMIKGK